MSAPWSGILRRFSPLLFSDSASQRTSHVQRDSRHTSRVENLEPRRHFAAVTVNAGTTIRAVDTKLLGVNAATWDYQLPSTQTLNMSTAIGTSAVRIPGGSTADDYHWNVNSNKTIGDMATYIANTNSVGMMTINYGTGSPQEAAACLAYLTASPSSTVAIGAGEQWNGTAWASVDWKTAGYWASLRSAGKLTNDDGLNFLRLGRSAPFNVHYWEIGNELYGNTWETDKHGGAGDTLPMPAGKTSQPWDPTTYVSFSKQFAALAAQINPGISIGMDSGSSDNGSTNWTVKVLTQCATQGFTPGFISDHLYDQAPGGENDSTLLSTPSKTVSPTPTDPYDWVQRAAKYRTMLNSKLGTTTAAGVELLATEFNSVYGNPGKQSVSLVNGLFVADSLGSLAQTEYNGAYVWDLHNSYATTGENNDSGLYGWRQGGDYGLLGTNGSKPASGLNTPYPAYFAEQLASKVIQAGGSVVQTSSSDPNLDVFAVKEADGHLKLLVINKSLGGLNNDTTGTPGSISATFTLNGYITTGAATLYQYGSAEDNAQKNSGTGAASLTTTSPTYSLNGGSFTTSFPSYSMSVVDLTPVTNAPLLVGSTFSYATSPNTISLKFDQPLLPSSISTSDLVLQNLTTGYVPGVQAVDYDAGTNTATFIFNNGTIQNGNYTATLPAGSVSSSTGVATTTPAVASFFSLAGDANHDAVVDITDLGILASHWQTTGNTFATGDFNYDGSVDITDLGILASNWQQNLPQTLAPAKLAASGKHTQSRVSDLIGLT